MAPARTRVLRVMARAWVRVRVLRVMAGAWVEAWVLVEAWDWV